MPLVKFDFTPGINKESTSYAIEGSWFDSNLIRFRKGRPEKMGGWAKLSSNTIEGIGRSLHTWATVDNQKLMGLGTSKKFYIEEGGGYNDITPIRRSVTLSTNPLTTGSSGTGTISVTDAAHGANTGDFVTLSGAATVDGINASLINKEFEITVITADVYTITTTGSASSGNTVGGGSSIIANYDLNAGFASYASGNGFGAGFWNGYSQTYSQTTLNDSGGISDSDSSFTLTSASDFETASTTTSTAITVLDSTISAANASSFPSKGTILIDSEKIRYTSISNNIFTGVTRGADGTTIATHTSGATITFVGLVLIDNELIQYTGKSSNTINAGVVRGARGTVAVAHDDGVIVVEANSFVGWGETANVSATVGGNLRLWCQDNFGEDLAFNVVDSPPYYWDKDLGVTTRATSLSSQTGASDAPTITRRIMMSGSDRRLICFACNPLGQTTQDLLQIRWSDQENPFVWTPTSTNTAGSQRISSGSEIISAQRIRQEILVWTDMNLHTMRFVGSPFVFSFSILAGDVSIIAPNAATVLGDRCFWMGQENFYVYSGRVQILPCTVLKYVFDDINLEQSRKFFAASNKLFDEIFWFYVSNSATEIDRYVKYSVSEKTWDIGELSRTAWVDAGIHNRPRACGQDDSVNYVYLHEQGTDADGVAMNSYVESGDFDLADGENFMLVRKIIPDVAITTNSNSSVNFVIKTRNFPGNSLATNSTNEVFATTEQSFTRARARQAVLRVESTALDVSWTLGSTRLDLKQDGKR